jgi:hypothetical protein
VNQPLPFQLTVARLRELLATVPDDVVVGLKVPAGAFGDPDLATFYNLRAEYSGGPVVAFVPVGTPSSGP